MRTREKIWFGFGLSAAVCYTAWTLWMIAGLWAVVAPQWVHAMHLIYTAGGLGMLYGHRDSFKDVAWTVYAFGPIFIVGSWPVLGTYAVIAGWQDQRAAKESNGR